MDAAGDVYPAVYSSAGGETSASCLLPPHHLNDFRGPEHEAGAPRSAVRRRRRPAPPAGRPARRPLPPPGRTPTSTSAGSTSRLTSGSCSSRPLLSFLLGLLMAEAAGGGVTPASSSSRSPSSPARDSSRLHALATPGVLLTGKNAGFQIASAIGLLIASGLRRRVRASARRGRRRRRDPARRRLLFASVGRRARRLGRARARDAASAGRADHARRRRADRCSCSGCLGVVFYGYAAYRYARLCSVQRAPVALAVVRVGAAGGGDAGDRHLAKLARELVGVAPAHAARVRPRRAKRLGRVEARGLERRGLRRPLRGADARPA